MRISRQTRLLCAIPLMSAGCGLSSSPTAPPPTATVAKVEVVVPKRETIRRIEQCTGRLEAAEVAPIHAKVSGYLKTVAVDIGMKVKKGQILAEISAPEIAADLEQKESAVRQAQARQVQGKAGVSLAKASVVSAEAKVGAVKAGLRRAEADATRWRSEFARTKQLAEEKAVTQSVLDESKSKLESAEAALDTDLATVRSVEASLVEAKAMLEKAQSDVVAADSGVEFARAEVHHAEAMLGYTKIEAPFEGTVIRRNADTGQLTIAGPQGQPLFEVVRVDVLTAVLVVPERVALLVSNGNPVEIKVPGHRDKLFKSKVSRTSKSINPTTGTSHVEIDLPNTDGALQPGLYIRAGVTIEQRMDTLTIPSSAVIRSGGQEFCACIEAGKVVRKLIEVGIEEGTRIEVIRGLTGAEAVVKENGGALAVGQSVEAAQPASTAKAAGS